MSDAEEIKKKMFEKMLQNVEDKREIRASPIVVTDDTFETILSQYETVVIDFWAPWCGPCKMLAPVIDELAQMMTGNVTFAKLNTDENQKTAMKYKIMSIPTLLLFKNGELVDRTAGVLPAQILKSWIERYL